MAYPLDQNPTAKNPNNAPDPSKEKDLELATRMCIQMLDQGGLKVLAQALQSSKDPVQVIGQFIGQLFGTIGEKLQKMGLDMSVFTMKNGVLKLVLNYLQKRLGISESYANRIYVEVMNMIKAGAQGGQPQRTPPGAGAPPEQEEAGEDQQEEAAESPEEENQEEEEEPPEPSENEPPEPRAMPGRKY